MCLSICVCVYMWLCHMDDALNDGPVSCQLVADVKLSALDHILKFSHPSAPKIPHLKKNTSYQLKKNSTFIFFLYQHS